MSSFRDFRNLELSTIDFLTDEINSNGNNSIIVIKSFSQAANRWTPKQPIVCIRLRDIAPIREEVGSEDYRYEVDFVIDVFGTSDGNRLDLAAQITDSLKTSWAYKTFSKDSGEDNAIGTDADKAMRVVGWNQNSKLEFGEDVDPIDRFRHVLSFTAGVR